MIKLNDYALKGYVRPVLGTDPELFFSKNGKIIGSEKVMPEGGIIYRHGITALNGNKTGENKVIIDGVQVELNPLSSQCRESLASNIQSCFRNLSERLKMKEYVDVSVDFSPLIMLEKEELDSLSGDSKRFGCMPSKNAYGEERVANNVDPAEYLYRCAGGHIHLGIADADYGQKTKVTLNKILKERHEKLVKLMDIIVGNTCVLLDRDPGNVERRKVYGRAGEYRTPPHGVEYRTLSNFWLRGYPLMSFVMGLARFAVNIMANGDKHYNAVVKLVNSDDIRKAINENDFELAYKNFLKIEKVILEMAGSDNGGYAQFPLNKGNIDEFKYVVKVGIDEFFKKEDAMKHWTIGRTYGWERWLEYIIKPIINPNVKTPNVSHVNGSSGGAGGIGGSY